MKPLQIAVVGGGWAGLAAAIGATLKGHQVTLLEATQQLGGRARTLVGTNEQVKDRSLDNGQHILIGAYSQTLALMRMVGVDPDICLLRLPLTMQFPGGEGLRLPNWPAPLNILAGVLCARGWSVADKWSLLHTTLRWQRASFNCDTQQSVAELCRDLSPKVMQTLIEPLCVSALNTPAQRASGQVFLRVLKDALFGGKGSSNLLLPANNLSALFPDAAAAWLESNGASLRLGHRVQQLRFAQGWQIDGQDYDTVIWATASSVARQAQAQTSAIVDSTIAAAMQDWAAQVSELRYESIATIYVKAGNARLAQAMQALHSSPNCPAQFVFDRGQLGGPVGLLALVVSASSDERSTLIGKVLQQARSQLKNQLQGQQLVHLQTVVEKRATFACTPGMQRPVQHIAPGLLACGDYVQGPYPATLEGAVRSGLEAANSVGS